MASNSRSKIFNHNLLILLSVLFSSSVFAQEENGGTVRIHAESELKPSKQNNILSTVIKVVNGGERNFAGTLEIDIPDGLRSISGNKVAVNAAAADSTFVPVRFLINPGIASGNNQIRYRLMTDDNKQVDEAGSTYAVDERIDLSLTVENRNIMITNVADSVHVSAIVMNNGNKAQDVVVVFSIPTMQKGINFVEQKIYLEPQVQHKFMMSFLPQKELIAQTQFIVKIAAMYGSDKNLFGNATVNIQNVSSSRVFEDPTSYHGLSDIYDRNAISLSHRSTNHGSGITQLNGSADVDLPAGYINLKGNIYKYGTNDQAIATNTSLSYLLGENEYMLGNVYESLETSISGRGAKVRIGSRLRDNLVVGIIDQEYNLLSNRPMFADTYAAFVKGEKHYSGSFRKLEGDAIYQRDGREMSHDLITGGELNWDWRNRWSASMRLHAAMSRLMTDGSNTPSGSAELRYGGGSKGFNLSGNYYYSTNYFPGNRRGILSLQQSLSKKMNQFTLHSNAYYSRFTPRSHLFSINTNTANFMGDADIYFPKLKNVTFGLGYQHQYESTNSYSQYQSVDSQYNMGAHRLRGSMMWSGQKSGHSANLSGEVGRSKNSIHDDTSNQFRVNLSYSFKWINLMTQYQRGSYYVSELIASGRDDKPYKRFISSVSVNRQLFNNKLSLMANVGLNKDFYSRFSPSGYANVRYVASEWFSFFVNSNWYSYKYRDIPSINTFSNEFGLTVHLHGNRANTTKKSRVSAFVYHDNNSNGVYDAGDGPAKGYPVTINKKLFITNDKGEATYRKVPFGKYVVEQISEQGWFSKSDTLKVNKFKTTKQIALQQAGVVSGRIRYNFDSRTSMEIDPKIEGVIFQINSTDGTTRHRVSTNDDATFTAFLPTGEYTIELITASLPANTTCEVPLQMVKVEQGKIIRLEPFAIAVQQKKVNIKRFGE